MSQPIVRKVELRLERLMSQGAGPTVGQAVQAAQRNLQALQPACLKVLDDRLAQIASILAIDPAQRPLDADFAAVLSHADEALTACTPLDTPVMAQALLLLSAQTDALRHADRWPVGALSPAVSFVTMVRTGQVQGAAADHLIRELRVCLDQYLGFATRLVPDV